MEKSRIMNGQTNIKGKKNAYFPLLMLFVIALSTIPEYSLAGNLGGNIQLTGIKTESESNQSVESLRQAYTVNWMKPLTENLTAQASLRYNNLGLDQSQSGNSWRSEFQPGGDLSWQNDYFLMMAGGRYLESKSNNSFTNLIRKSVGINFTSNLQDYPILKLRYDWDRNYNEKNRTERDTRHYRIQAGLSHEYKTSFFYYNVSRSVDKNFNSGLDLTTTQHNFRVNSSTWTLENKLRLAGSYNFNYRTQASEAIGSDVVYEVVPFIESYYLHDPTPEFDQLDTLSALRDGNKSDPTSPMIDIGEGILDQNVGLDFGDDREVSGLYIYTDRPSGELLGWNVFISDDNLAWNPVTVQTISFNSSYNRYEIIFTKRTARYIKAVNFGLNDVLTVFVTEIEPLLEHPETDRLTRNEQVHQIDFASIYRFSDEWEVSGDATIHTEPNGDFANSRNHLYYSVGARHKPNVKFVQSIKWQAGYDKYKITNNKNSSRILSYNLKYKPIGTIELALAAINRVSYLTGIKEQETSNLLLQAKGVVTPRLTLSADIGFDRNNIFLINNIYDSWTFRLASESQLRRSLTLTAGTMYQRTATKYEGGVIERSRHNFSLNYLVTRSISIRASLILDYNGGQEYTNQEYNLSWTLSSKLSLGALATFTDDNRGLDGERQNIRLNYLVGSRTSLYMSFTNNKYSLNQSSNNRSYQIGLKTGF